MKYFANTVFEQIRKQIHRHLEQGEISRKLLFMMPSVPADVVEMAGSRLTEYCAEHKDLALPLIRVANDLFQEWYRSDDTATREYCRIIADKGWRDERGNLTSYRNVQAGENGCLVVLLIGVDRIADSSSMADFHHCNHQTLWEEELLKSFTKWMSKILTEAHIAYEEDDTLPNFDRILKPLVERGIADILQVSSFLECIDLSAAQDGKDAEAVLLRSLGHFGMPLFSGYRFTSRKSFGPYIDDAISFFSYDAFLEDRNRLKALDKIDKFVQFNKLGAVFDPSDREPFTTDQEFIDALKKYIDTNDTETREMIRQCDYVTIRDKILNYRPPREKNGEKVSPVKKLAGGPIEIVLTALWSTLAEYKKEAITQGVFAHEALKEIRIESSLFKHDCDGESPDERMRKARSYIARMLGGVDELLEQWIDTAKMCGQEKNAIVKSRLVHDEIDCQSARTAEPFLQFSIALHGIDWDEPITKQFAWRLPEIEPYRVVDEMLQWSAQGITAAKGYCLPVYHVPYYEELMLAKDDEETRRVLLQCIQDEGGGLFNLLSVSDLDKKDPLLKHVKELAYEYDRFIQKARAAGLHKAIASDWDSLRKAYEKALDFYLLNSECANSTLATLLFRAFLIIYKRPSAEGERWIWEGFEPSAVVTALHPAFLEMLQAHILYLLTSFSTVAGRELRAPGTTAFRNVVWQNYVDLAALQMPLSGIIKDRNRILDTNVRGNNLIHRIGSMSDSEASLTTRLLLRYDAFDDEDISDAELFRMSRESMLLYRILRDYRKLHPHADDGLSVAVYQNQDIQPIIAAVDEYLSELCSNYEELSGKYSISVTIFTESSDDTSVSRWISQWKERWEAAETQDSLIHYRYCNLSIAHRIVSPEGYYRQFRQLISDGLEVDIAILNGFIGAGEQGNDFEIVEPYDVTTRTLKFPILEKSFCALRDPGRQLQRARVLSNRQFRITTRHAELMARLKNRATPQNTSHVVLGYGDYAPWQKVVDELHMRAEWVVCIDPNIDERLIAVKGSDDLAAREIIGFGSGVGAHGEANYTISTEQFHLSDILTRLTASIGEVYNGWDHDTYEKVAQSVLSESRRLSGLSLVRATGIGQYIRDFMAYALTRKLLSGDENLLCDQLVSMDAYRHWFDSADSDTRPDLLWVVARVGKDGRIRLELRLIECKMAKMSEAHLDKARQQLENGLRHLVGVFKPRKDDEGIDDDRPDQRYWWLQIHRLISSKAVISGREQSKVLTALERLSEGDYDIQWSAAAISFWTDKKTDEIGLSDVWTYSFEGKELGISVISVGSVYVRSLCTAEISSAVPWNPSFLNFEAVTHKSEEAPAEVKPEDVVGERTSQGLSIDAISDGNEKPDITQGSGNGDIGLALQTKVPERILLGKSIQGARNVFWEFGHDELSNRHMLLFGTSGMGKTYTIECLLYELGKCGQNSLIVDYTNGFFDDQLESEFKARLHPVQHVVRRNPLPINPFRRQVDMIGSEPMYEGAPKTAQRVSGVFSEVYSMGDQQKSALYEAVKRGISASSEGKMTFEELIHYLEEMTEEKGAIGASAGTVISKIRPFVDQNPFGAEDPESWERLFTDVNNRCHIIQLTGFLRDASRLITEFSLIDLYWFYRGRGSKDAPRVIVLDEVQNLDHRDESPLAQLLTEGRKFGFSLILATQIMSSLEKDERDRLFNAGHKLFFRPVDTEVRSYADIAAISSGEKADEWVKRLASLRKGECYSLGPSLNESTGKLENKAFKIRITSLAERINV